MSPIWKRNYSPTHESQKRSEAVEADQTLSKQQAKYTYDSSTAYGSYIDTEYSTTLQELQNTVDSAESTLEQAKSSLKDYRAQLEEVTAAYEDAAFRYCRTVNTA